MEEFLGQDAVVEALTLACRAARARGEPLDHVLLSGWPGLGKTTLAHLLAGIMGGRLHEASAPVLQRAADLAGLLTRLEPGDILFIDEIHRLAKPVEEYLYSAMEDFVLDVVLDQGAHARSVRVDLAPFTLVGATTREGMLTAPLRDRFTIRERLEPYPWEVLSAIARRTAGVLGVAMDEEAASHLARRARGTPRVVNRFVRRVRDLAQVEGHGAITAAVARAGLERLGVDEEGLDRLDRLVLGCLARAGGRPLGLKTIAAAVGEDERTLEEVAEPHLLREGYLVKTSRGRALTPRGERHAGVPASDGLFPQRTAALDAP